MREEDEPAILVCEGECHRPTLHEWHSVAEELHSRYGFVTGTKVMYQCAICKNVRKWGFMAKGSDILSF